MVDNNTNVTNDYSAYINEFQALLNEIAKFSGGSNNNGVPAANTKTELTDESLAKLIEPTAKLSVDVLVQAIGFAQRRVSIQKSADQIKVKGDEQKEINDKKLQEIAKKLEELAKKNKLNGFLKAFRWIGAIFGTIASAVTTVVGVVTGNPVMVAAGVLGLVSSIDSIVSLASDGKKSLSVLFTKWGKAMGMSDETAQKFSLGMTVGLAVATMAVGIGAGVSGLAKGVESASKALQTLKNISSICTFVNSGVAATTAGLQIGNTVVDHRIAKTHISQKEFEAMLEQLREAQKMLKEFIEAEMKRNEALMTAVKEIIDDMNHAQLTIQTSAPSTMA